jgi:DNA-binding MurR/RpiR family transcriptional regulator
MIVAGLMERIRNAAPNLTESERILADYFLANPTQAAFWPASKFARTLGVSEATVVRFARSLDYETYSSLQKDVQQQVEVQLRAPIPGRFEKSLEEHGDHPLMHAVNQDVQNLRASLDALDVEQFEAAAGYLAETQQLLVAGMRASEPIASFIAYAFSYVIPEVIPLIRQPDTYFEPLVRIKPGACLMAASFARNSVRTIQIVETARERGARAIVFTDSPLSPIAQMADALLVVRTDSPSFIQSFTAVFSMVNALLLSTSARRGEEAGQRVEEIEEMLRRYDVVLFPNGKEAK